ncbi:MAG: cytochrome b/b6 domain-containing protein [Albidovulum sp.]|nr:cytochrome b/b6 domain-containing protein [Albidovulum sp.]MDE0532045.1 cytochrome b/b6 domain-containing protein [Albidovulum sp.]
MTNDRLGGDARRENVRHLAADRLFHWIMALAVIVLGATSFLPIVGIKFEWVPVHWMAGVLLTLSVLFHLYRVFFVHGLKNMVPTADDIREFGRDIRGSDHRGLSEAKFDALQKGYHAAAATAVIAAIATGLLMLAKIDTTFWRRDPSILSDQTWGFVYVIHGASAMILLFLFFLHVYFAVLPEHRELLISMIRGKGPKFARKDPG